MFCLFVYVFLVVNFLEDQCSELLAELGLDGEDPPDTAGMSCSVVVELSDVSDVWKSYIWR